MSVKEFIDWLFNDPNGHFALICFALLVTAGAWLVIYFSAGAGPATPVATAVGMLFQAFIQKTR